ncbi:hypothetical protein A0J57_10605 [Sphingobium sp. 22B]|jgi:hypothetical protein|uniref:hypothetical protein n=1 Tax=unclassified Sphingobium TaxID=2611147 RepID=UPI0007851B9A|nr:MULTISPECIES: hypothetical protein [unclassified Sphingobium]KXU30114.1 hypothetical protein AXW74_19390 [Sphingobium sp. AM]KYC32371.1 hypothetical protein A0J57_10605 [Sphingobium sp. 22B]OAP32000.1 hypothetical protein A8O16_10395 [Sphingobium sp. 20006FA]
MNTLAEKMCIDLLGRQLTGEDYIRMDKMLRHLPSEVRDSPGSIAEIIMRMENLKQFDAIVQRASFEAQQKIHKDLPRRVEIAAQAALCALRDQLPIDSSDAMRRLYKWGAMWMLSVSVIGFTVGVTFTKWWVSRPEMHHYAATETAFNRCIDASFGAASNGQRNGRNASAYDSTEFRNSARICAAEYADRRDIG